MDAEARLLAEFAALPDSNPGEANKLFTGQRYPDYFPGNTTAQPSRPFEFFCKYEKGLRILQAADAKKFNFIHKGIPYYFMAWTAFDFHDYERAVFFMDAALSEDIRNGPTEWENWPAAMFLFLKKDAPNQSAKRITTTVHDRFDRIITKFNGVFGENFTVDQLIQRYVHPEAIDNAHRSTVTALYSFVLEAEEREELLKLRSAGGGSIEPFVIHLFKGCLVFESILKEIYPGMVGSQLGKILKDPFIQHDLKFNGELIDRTAAVRHTLQDIVRHLIPFLVKESPSNRALALTYALRNTTAHSLLWPDVFANSYQELHEAITFAICYLLVKKF